VKKLLTCCILVIGLQACSSVEGPLGGVAASYRASILECTKNTHAIAALSTTVAADSSSGQPVINLAAVTGLSAGDPLVIAPTISARKETCVVVSISTLAVTCTSNLLYTHTSGQADPVYSTNRVGPLTPGFYSFYCLDSSAALLGCRCRIGDQYVYSNSPTFNTGSSIKGEVIAQNSKEVWEVPNSSDAYVSCQPTAAGRVEACPK
jgi:hypothetical protein